MYHFRDLDSPTWLDIALYISFYICVSVKTTQGQRKMHPGETFPWRIHRRWWLLHCMAGLNWPHRVHYRLTYTRAVQFRLWRDRKGLRVNVNTANHLNKVLLLVYTYCGLLLLQAFFNQLSSFVWLYTWCVIKDQQDLRATSTEWPRQALHIGDAKHVAEIQLGLEIL